jgi:prevent-host-death family protein
LPEILDRKYRDHGPTQLVGKGCEEGFSEIVDAAQHMPQTVTKHGKPAVVVIDVAEYDRLRRLERTSAPSFADLLLAMPQDDGQFPPRNVRMRDIEF